jgi:tight adherence protein B
VGTFGLPLGGMLVGLGVWLLIAVLSGWVDVAAFSRSQRHVGRRATLQMSATPHQLLSGIAVALGLFVLTRWWALAVVSLIGSVLFSGKFPRRAIASQTIEASVALATWAERVRDSVRAGAALTTAFHAAARSCPPLITGAAQRLADDASTIGITAALLRFGTALDVGAADQIVMALIVAEQKGGRELPSLLGAEIDAIRHEVAVEKEEAGIRQRVRTAIRVIVATIMISVVGYRFLSRTFLLPYNSMQGQMVLLIAGAIILASLGRIVKLAERAPRARLFDPAAVSK